MRKKFLGLVCLLYFLLIIYVFLTSRIKNFLAPQMQIYLKVSIIPLLIMSIIVLFDEKFKYKFKLSDLVLLLPIIMMLFQDDGKLTSSFASNRMTNLNQKTKSIKKINTENTLNEDNDYKLEDASSDNYDFTNPYFNINDENYDALSNYITYAPKASKYFGKTIKVRGFSIKNASFLKEGYFAIGKYSISCCAADAEFTGFIAKYDIDKIEDNLWYEIEGVLEKGTDKEGYDIMYIRVINVKEIDSKDEKQYVYPCYSYDDGACSMLSEYDLEY